jgi:hypothetical protein
MNGYLLMGNAQARYPDRDLCYGTFQLTGLEYNVQDPETVGIPGLPEVGPVSG